MDAREVAKGLSVTETTDVRSLAWRLRIFRERIASATAATNMSTGSQATAIAMITTMYAGLFEEIADYFRVSLTSDDVAPPLPAHAHNGAGL